MAAPLMAVTLSALGLGVIFFLGRVRTFECHRGAGGGYCALREAGIAGSSAQRWPLTEVLGGRTDQLNWAHRCRLHLRLQREEVPIDFVWTRQCWDTHDSAAKLDAFVSDPRQTDLEIHSSELMKLLVFGGGPLLIGLFLGLTLWWPCTDRITFDAGAQEVACETTQLFEKRKRRTFAWTTVASFAIETTTTRRPDLTAWLRKRDGSSELLVLIHDDYTGEVDRLAIERAIASANALLAPPAVVTPQAGSGISA